MKVAVSSMGKDLDAQIDPRFGRCAYFIIVETDDMSFEVFDNENNALGGGAGIQSAQFVASKGAEAVITGNCGPKAVSTLSTAGITLFVDQSGTGEEAIKRFKNNKLSSTTDANVPDHYGTGSGGVAEDTQMQGSGRGSGMGRRTGGGRGMGRGMGGGRGMGRGMGMNRGMAGWNETNPGSPDGLTDEQELGSLKKQASALKKQMEEIQERIGNLERR